MSLCKGHGDRSIANHILPWKTQFRHRAQHLWLHADCVCAECMTASWMLYAGTNSIQSILSTVIFNIGPQIFDIAAACVYLATALQPWIAVIVFVTLISYIPVTIYFTEWRGNFRR